jgi:hypothetical protein
VAVAGGCGGLVLLSLLLLLCCCAAVLQAWRRCPWQVGVVQSMLLAL